MKISKLFHWLYALLMLAPVFAIGVTCLYAIFNKNAYRSYYGDTINESQIIQATNFKVGKEYTTTYSTPIPIETVTNNFIYVTDMEFLGGNNNVNLQNLISHQNEYWRFRYTYNSNNINLEFQRLLDNQNVTDYYTLVNNYNTNPSQYSLSFKYKISEINTSNAIYTQILPYTTYIEYNNYSFVSDVFYYSIDRVTNSPYFNWAYDSFLVAPFSYIVVLFSMPANSPIVMMLSYWLAISIIWLVFDLVMYIPLLVHRWIDKGVIE